MIKEKYKDDIILIMTGVYVGTLLTYIYRDNLTSILECSGVL